MLSDHLSSVLKKFSATVLILVLMEYALWLEEKMCSLEKAKVLILVLMEYALWPKQSLKNSSVFHRLNPCSNGICSLTSSAQRKLQYNSRVLILVLMEYALWQQQAISGMLVQMSLNPCSNGICSLTVWKGVGQPIRWRRLNPCSNGICSLTTLSTSFGITRWQS